MNICVSSADVDASPEAARSLEQMIKRTWGELARVKPQVPPLYGRVELGTA
jgi:hypothetical protein